MKQFFVKYTRYIMLLGFVIYIGIVVSYPVVRAGEEDVLPTTPDSANINITPLSQEITVDTTNQLDVDEVSTDTRAPWVWSSRIAGGGGIGIRNVGGYVYVSTSGWRCNGALIDPEWVVTNAGCVTENRITGATIAPSRISVVTGCYGVDNCVTKRNPLWYGTQSQVVRVQQVKIYQPNPNVSDVDMTVALLKLSAPVTTGNGVQILPVGLSSDVIIEQNGLTVMSYGDIPPNAGPARLQRAPYRITNGSACSGFAAYRDVIHHCGEPVPQVCKNDWGAPVTRVVNGQVVLYGILASQYAVHGISCPKNVRSVAIDVTSDGIRSWIATTVRAGRVNVTRNLGGSSGYGTALARGNNRQHVVDISGVFPQGIRIGSVTSTKLSINENGIIALGSMTSGIPAYLTMSAWRGAPVIVAFGADGDTTGTAQRPAIGGNSTGSNQVWVAQDSTRRVVVVTWDDIRPFSTSVTGARYIGNTYQAELRAQENGDVKVTLRYGIIGWTAGATQCGANCNGKYAQVGIADGRGKFQLGIPVASTNDSALRQLGRKQLTFYLRDGVIFKVNQTPPLRRVHNPIFIWTGRNNEIPAGWKRVTVLDGKFPRVVSPSDRVLVTGGSSTHTHSSPAHSHTMLNHTHITSYGRSINTSTTNTKSGDEGTASGHIHESVITSQPIGVSVSSASVTYSAFSNNPPYYEVIFITKIDGDVNVVPPGAIALSKKALGSLTLANGLNGTPNLQKRFIRGASTAANAGEIGGYSTNTHTINHDHVTTHDHADQWAGRDLTTSKTDADEAGKPDNTLLSHSHMTYYNPTTINTTGTSAISTPETVLPPYTDFVIGQNKTGRNLTQTGVLALYTGSATDLPRGWVLYSKIGTLIRGSNRTGAKGGSETHTHAPSTHTHPNIPHSHTGSTSETSGTHDNDDSGRTSVRRHYHDISVSTASVQLSSAVTTANEANNMPEYVNVYLIEYVGK